MTTTALISGAGTFVLRECYVFQFASNAVMEFTQLIHIAVTEVCPCEFDETVATPFFIGLPLLFCEITLCVGGFSTEQFIENSYGQPPTFIIYSSNIKGHHRFQ